ESGKKHAFPRFHLESFLSYIHVELSFKDVEKFVLACVHVRRRFSSGRQHCLHQVEGSVAILLFREVCREIPVCPLRQPQRPSSFKCCQRRRCIIHVSLRGG